MAFIDTINVLQLGSLSKETPSIHENSSVPRIVKNIEEISERYRRNIENEINNELAQKDKHIKDIQKLNNKIE